MRLIITRPQADASALSAKLAALGHQPLLMPLLRIVWNDGPPLGAVGVQAVCASSANGLKTQRGLRALLHLPFFAVGPQSAAAARAAGFATIDVAPEGNLSGLAAVLRSRLSPRGGHILYLSGQEISGDLAGQLKPYGFTVEREIVYAAEPVHPAGLSEAIATADGVLLYSPRSARLWLEAAARASQSVAGLKHFCLSASVAAVLPQSIPTFIAEQPDEAGMLAVLSKHA